MTTVRSTAMTHELPGGCHPAIRESLTLPAGIPTEIPAAALRYVLGLPGVELHTLPEPPAPEAPSNLE